MLQCHPSALVQAGRRLALFLSTSVCVAPSSARSWLVLSLKLTHISVLCLIARTAMQGLRGCISVKLSGMRATSAGRGRDTLPSGHGSWRRSLHVAGLPRHSVLRASCFPHRAQIQVSC